MNIAKLVRMVQVNYGEDDPLLAEILDLILHEIYELETRMDYLQSQISDINDPLRKPKPTPKEDQD